MAKEQFTYAVGLVNDPLAYRRQKPTYTQADSLLKEFLIAQGGEHVGYFTQDNTAHLNYALAMMTSKDEEKLQELNWRLHLTENSQPFIERIEDSLFDIALADKMIIHTDSWEQKIKLGTPSAFGTS